MAYEHRLAEVCLFLDNHWCVEWEYQDQLGPTARGGWMWKSRHRPFPWHMYVPSHFSHVWLFVTQRTVAHQASLSMGFSRQEYWSGLSCPSPGDLPDPGIEPRSHFSCTGRQVLLAALIISPTWEAPFAVTWDNFQWYPVTHFSYLTVSYELFPTFILNCGL